LRGGDNDYPPDFDAATIAMIDKVREFTMTSPERLFALRQSVKYVVANHIPGAIVECGVWRGGSMMAVAHTLRELQVQDRDLYLFDTYDGMTAPTNADKNYRGQSAAALLQAESKADSWNWAFGPLDGVKQALSGTGYDSQRLFFVKGKVEETVPEKAPATIALLRLDTDWYESTYHELTCLFPRLSPGGVLILDDYGHWQGARRAADQYFAEQCLPILLHRIDYTGRVCNKPAGTVRTFTPTARD
jgi:hypothetical protein